MYFIYLSTLGWETPKITEERLERELASLPQEDLAPFIFTMDTFTINLKGEPKRTVQIIVNLEMLGKEGYEEVINMENRTRAKDRIISLVGDRQWSEVETIQGKLLLKSQITEEINHLLNVGVVKNIYFSQFVAQ